MPEPSDAEDPRKILEFVFHQVLSYKKLNQENGADTTIDDAGA